MVKKPTIPPPISQVSMSNGDHDPKRRGSGIFDNFSKKAPSLIHLHTKSIRLKSSYVNPQGRGKIVCQECRFSSRHKTLTPVPLQCSKKHKQHLPIKLPPSLAPPEDCVSYLPAGVPFPRKPAGCEIIPQTIEPRKQDRSAVYFTRNGVLGMPLRYMYDLDDMDGGDEPVNFGLDPTKSCHITLVIAWPGYKEATYQIIVYTPLYPTAPFVTVYGLRQLTKRELAIETLRCVHRWMIEHPWSGERHGGIPEWKLSREQSAGVSAKMVWLAMISPVGDGRWVTQLQKAPDP